MRTPECKGSWSTCLHQHRSRHTADPPHQAYTLQVSQPYLLTSMSWTEHVWVPMPNCCLAQSCTISAGFWAAVAMPSAVMAPCSACRRLLAAALSAAGIRKPEQASQASWKERISAWPMSRICSGVTTMGGPSMLGLSCSTCAQQQELVMAAAHVCVGVSCIEAAGLHALLSIQATLLQSRDDIEAKTEAVWP